MSLAHGPSSIITASSAASSISLTLSLLPPSYEDPVMTLGLPEIQGHPHFRDLDLIYLQSPSTMRGDMSTDPGTGMGASLGLCSSSNPTTK